jgi:hypothetical protein
MGDQTVQVPLLQPVRWQQIIREIFPEPPVAVTQIGQMEFRAIFADEQVIYHVRFMTDDTGEEHLVSLCPLWENQRYAVAQAFGREMILDETRQSSNNVLYVKSADGSPPDPTFERIMTYTLGDETNEYSVRIHKGQTMGDVKTGLAALHKGIIPAKLWYEDAELNEADPITDWASITGTSPLKIHVTVNAPPVRFQVWQGNKLEDLGEEEFDGRSKEEIWTSIQTRYPEVKAIGAYRLFNGRERVLWENLPIPEVTLVPKNIPTGDRGREFRIIDYPQVPRPREVGKLTQMHYQIFTIDKTEYSEVTEIWAPNEISLAQLVTYYILPTDIQLDVASVFYWNLRETPDAADSTRTILEQIPVKIPSGFCLRVKCNSLHEHPSKRLVSCLYDSVRMNFAMAPDATVGRLKMRVIDWMNARGLGSEWTIEGEEDDPIDFDETFHVTELVCEVPIRIFLKQEAYEVLPSMSWIKLSDQIVAQKHLPICTLLRIYPVDCIISDQDSVDFSYTFDWVADKQYWFDVTYEEGRDRHDASKQIKMVDDNGLVETLVVPRTANAQTVVDVWKLVLDIPEDIGVRAWTGNGEEFYWNYVTAKEMIPYTIRTPSFHMDVRVFPGSITFQADQISRLTGYKLPPEVTGQATSRQNGGAIVQFGEYMMPLGLKILKMHLLSWNLNGLIIKAPELTTWWIPYNHDAIMRYGHSVNSSIPEDPNEAEFPPTPWRDEVTIVIKSRASPTVPSAPIPAGGSAASAQPLVSPGSWQGPALGQAKPISVDAAGLTDYQSANEVRTVENQPEEPPDPEVLRLRGETGKDEEVHGMISWTTRKGYPLIVGISLPIPDESLDGAHEAQLWEEVDEELLFTTKHAEQTLQWLQTRLASHSTLGDLPVGMPDSIDTVSTQTWRDGKAGYILFVPSDMIANAIAESETKIQLEYGLGYMREGVGNAYTIQIIHDDFMLLTQNSWGLYPAHPERRLMDGTIVHKCITDSRTSQLIREGNAPVIHPPHIIEDRGRGSEIHNEEDMDRMLQYWAWAQLPLEVGIIFPTKDGLTIEFWMNLTLQRVVDDDEPGTYARLAKEMWLERLRDESPYVADPLSTLGNDFGMKMRYVSNSIRLWFVPNQAALVGFTRPLAEEPCSKDKWYSTTDLMAFSHPTTPDCHVGNLPLLLFGPHSSVQDRYDDPEVQGGKIALIALKQKRAQKPPNFFGPHAVYIHETSCV